MRVKRLLLVSVLKFKKKKKKKCFYANISLCIQLFKGTTLFTWKHHSISESFLVICMTNATLIIHLIMDKSEVLTLPTIKQKFDLLPNQYYTLHLLTLITKLYHQMVSEIRWSSCLKGRQMRHLILCNSLHTPACWNTLLKYTSVLVFKFHTLGLWTCTSLVTYTYS